MARHPRAFLKEREVGDEPPTRPVRLALSL